MMTTQETTHPKIEVVTAVHRLDRPVRRAVESVLACPDAAAIVVAHGIDPDALDLPDSSRVRVLRCGEKLGHPGAPKNLGIKAATAPYVALLDSDDYYEPGALEAMLTRLESGEADGVFANLARQGEAAAHLPLTWKTRNLKVSDRVLYRTAPLGLFRREVIQSPRYSLREDMTTGEDMQTSLRLWTDGLRLHYSPDDPAYVVGQDSKSRVTGAPRPTTETLRAINALVDEGELASLRPAHRKAAVTKILRTHVLGSYEHSLKESAVSESDLEHLAHTARRLYELSPAAVKAFSATDEAVIAAIASGDIQRIQSAIRGRDSANLIDRVLPRNKRFALSREGNLRTSIVGIVLDRCSKRSRLAPPSAKPRLLILSYSDINSDARVLKQVELFKDEYAVTTCGYGEKPIGVARHIEIPHDYMNLRLYGRYITLKQYRLAYWRVDAVRKSWELLKRHKRSFDVVLANEIESLPLALQLEARHGVLSDLHEYYPGLHEENPDWDRRIRPYYEWLCKRYLPRAAASTTVAEGIAEKYLSLTGVRPKVVTNATPYVDILPTPVHQPLRLVHHGAALRNRELHILIKAVNKSAIPLEMDMYLMPNDAVYLEELTQQAQGTRVRILEGVAYDQLINTLNNYDVGFYVLPPVSTNHEYALPNKFFDFIQARLALVIGPSKEMRRIVDRYELGVVTDDFSFAASVRALDSLTAEHVGQWKANANRHSWRLSAQKQVRVWADLVREMVGRPC